MAVYSTASTLQTDTRTGRVIVIVIVIVWGWSHGKKAKHHFPRRIRHCAEGQRRHSSGWRGEEAAGGEYRSMTSGELVFMQLCRVQ